jgi:hypothetical protein
MYSDRNSYVSQKYSDRNSEEIFTVATITYPIQILNTELIQTFYKKKN